jgi:hypothetical protein
MKKPNKVENQTTLRRRLQLRPPVTEGKPQGIIANRFNFEFAIN